MGPDKCDLAEKTKGTQNQVDEKFNARLHIQR
jgi:hypothetical protein